MVIVSLFISKKLHCKFQSGTKCPPSLAKCKRMESFSSLLKSDEQHTNG